ncbi:MAG: hypothetical protein C0423_05415 [Methylibium sp.]|nr:hypothetical protein [Methylibium sp.]
MNGSMFFRNFARIAGLSSLALASMSLTAQTDIATAPLFTTSTTNVKPNVLFILDDSGSMAWDYMPDDGRFGTSGYNHKYGRRASQCNGLAFNPDDSKAPYKLPVDAAGADLAAGNTDFLNGTYTTGINGLASGDPAVTRNQRNVTSPASLSVANSGTLTLTVSGAASTSYFVGMVVTVFGDMAGRYMIGKVASWSSATGAMTVNVAMGVGSGSFSTLRIGDGSAIDNVYYTYSGTQTPLDFRYPSNSLDTSSTFYKECNSSLNADPGKSVFTANIVTPGSAMAQRYANWYRYYSTRMEMMKTSMSHAFKDMDDKFRIGFNTINENTGGILNVADFNATQKSSFYSRFNGADPNNSTPLRAALSKAGRYYAKKVSGQTYDPVQYSCQKNFTILSTDGYWNGSAGYKLDGTAVGQQDGGGTARPMYDGGNEVTKTIETWNVTGTSTKTTVTPYTRTDTVTTTTYTPSAGQSYKTYAVGPLSVSRNNSDVDIDNCNLSAGKYTCRVTVKTSSNHGFSGGETVSVSGATPSIYNGSYTITRKDNDEYYYTLSGMSAIPSEPTSGNRGTSLYAPSGCPAGQGQVSEQLMTRDQRDITKSGTSTLNSWSTTLVQSVTTVTPYTRTITYVDGVLSSDVTAAGTPNVTTSAGSTSTSATTTTTTPFSTPSGSDFTPWVASGAPVVQGCAATKPADTAIVAAAATTSTVSVGPVSASGTNTAGTASISNSTPSETVGTKTVSTTTTVGGSLDSLSDVAMYYYQTDLRNSSLSNCTGALGKSVCENDVKALGKDTANWQHMTTFTLSLGMNGTFKYDPAYETQATGDFADLVNGNKNWPVPSSDGGAVNIDDLWHAAVNGRGRYFSASDPTTLASSLAAALNSIKAVVGTSSAAATSTLQPVEGDNGVYIAQFKSSEWTGDLKAYKINTTTGEVETSKLDGSGNRVDTADWSAGEKLTTSTVRTIYHFRPSGGGNGGSLEPFVYATMNATEKAMFDNACSKSPTLTQCAGLTGTALADVNSGANMVSFLRGQPQPQYRTRARVLGDIVNSSPVYVGKPSFQYVENGYASFKAARASRAPTLYVGANDGMLHAFNASDGTERWAYVPRAVMGKLYRLADSFYESKHFYTVDATPVVGDIYMGGSWRTILVGGLNAGGNAYFALDITDPNNPQALWEFSNANLGLSYGNPIITKRKDGTWVVVLSSGHNNADGQGHLFVVNALTGALLKDISTGVGSAGSPSGMSKLNAWVDSDADNLATRFYAGDLEGNIWRFDIDGNLEPKEQAFKLAQLLVAGVPQPITTQLQLAEIEANGSRHAVVYAGTGRYLGTSDVTSTAVQSIYAIKDSLSATGLGDVRAGGTLVKQTLATVGGVRKIDPPAPVDWSVNNGWYVDLVSERERINVDMQISFNTLTAAGNVPGNSATDCEAGSSGTAWLYQLDIVTGKAASKAIDSMVAGLSTVQLGKGPVTIVTKVDAGNESVPQSAALAQPGTARRSSWRELID